MSDRAPGSQHPLREALREGLHQYGAVTCDSCGKDVDLTSASDLSEAGGLWNRHLRLCDEVAVAVGDEAESGEWISTKDGAELPRYE